LLTAIEKSTMQLIATSRLRRGAGWLACSLVTALLAQPAAAADPAEKKAPARTTAKTPAKPPGKAAPTAKPNLMTRDELRACMDEQDRLQQLGDRVKQEQAAAEQMRAQVQQIDAEVARKRAALDPADVAANQAIVDQVARRDQIVDAYNARLPTLREQGASFDGDRQSWVERCTRRDFDEMDEAVIKRDRRRAAGSPK
jgi:hypothetical protein